MTMSDHTPQHSDDRRSSRTGAEDGGGTDSVAGGAGSPAADGSGAAEPGVSGRDGFGGDVWAPPEPAAAASEREVPLPDTVIGDLPDSGTDSDPTSTGTDPLAQTLITDLPSPPDDTLIGPPPGLGDLRAELSGERAPLGERRLGAGAQVPADGVGDAEGAGAPEDEQRAAGVGRPGLGGRGSSSDVGGQPGVRTVGGAEDATGGAGAAAPPGDAPHVSLGKADPWAP
ncbi:hypothetical protein DY218_19825, partial [Streptomyces triticagri]